MPWLPARRSEIHGCQGWNGKRKFYANLIWLMMAGKLGCLGRFFLIHGRGDRWDNYRESGTLFRRGSVCNNFPLSLVGHALFSDSHLVLHLFGIDFAFLFWLLLLSAVFASHKICRVISLTRQEGLRLRGNEVLAKGASIYDVRTEGGGG